MKLPRLKMLLGFLLATFLTAPAWAADAADRALPGTLNYVEGQASIADQVLDAKSIGSASLEPGQTLTTGNGKAEILLTPGVFLRVGDNSTVKMVSTKLTDIEADLEKGQATVEIAELHQYNQFRLDEDGAATYMLKDGLYAFDADRDQVRVLKGEALVQDNDQQVKVKGGHELDLNQTGHLKAVKFDKDTYEASDLYRFSDLRSSYLAEANVDIARQYYAGGPGWYGPGWYWDPWFWSYTWLPGDGIFYDPFGWGFYSPWFAGYAPIFYRGYGYGYGGIYGFRNYVRNVNIVSPTGQPVRTAGGMPRSSQFGVAGSSLPNSGGPRAEGFRGGNIHSGGGGFGGGGGFHGGGFGGGGHH
ncbi:MAG TPA: hypothetical protein VF783_03805 [Terriglobales bacterium]